MQALAHGSLHVHFPIESLQLGRDLILDVLEAVLTIEETCVFGCACDASTLAKQLSPEVGASLRQVKLFYRTLGLVHVVLVVQVHMLDINRLDRRVTDDDWFAIEFHIDLDVTHSGPLLVYLVFELPVPCEQL